jgi:hypothetical protein
MLFKEWLIHFALLSADTLCPADFWASFAILGQAAPFRCFDRNFGQSPASELCPTIKMGQQYFESARIRLAYIL